MASKAYECWNEYWADVESNEDYSALTFYHGRTVVTKKFSTLEKKDFATLN